jgi:hypothetical protein
MADVFFREKNKNLNALCAQRIRVRGATSQNLCVTYSLASYNGRKESIHLHYTYYTDRLRYVCAHD